MANEYNPYDPAVLQDPYPCYERMRARSPMFRSSFGSGYWGYTLPGEEEKPIYVAIGYDELSAVLEDSERFTSAFKTGPDPSPVIHEEIAAAGGHPVMPTLYSMDPPEHTRRRRLLQRAMSAERVAAREHEIRAVAGELVEGFAAGGHAELIDRFCTPFVKASLFEHIGVPRQDHEKIAQGNEAFKEVCIPGSSDLELRHACRELVDYQRYFEGAIAERQREPRNDLLGLLAEARKDPDCPISTAEMGWGLMDMIGAGYGNTIEALANLLYLLLSEPDRWAELVADRALVASAVEEGLRFDGPVHWLSRNTTEEVELGGETLPKDVTVVCAFAAANRDPEAFPEPEKFDLRRGGAGKHGRHLATGRGVHYCFGALWARAALRVGVEVLLDRLPGLRLSDGFEVSYLASAPMFRVVSEMPVRW
ncbi:cytochrome P450 [Amycolatopsis speibonae]|uniref:Cytochrome P450 n=1 Tax=Amycolatopsis speibonae TaxID=1450224 RepID=A0ABV7NPM6_9PSEU